MRTILQSLCAMAVVAIATGPASAVNVTLLDSGGGGIAGGNVYYYNGGWQLLGTTPDNGTLCGNLPKTTDVEIRYAGGKYKWPLLTNAADVSISTVPVSVKLLSSAGAPLIGEAFYYYDGWSSLGNTAANVELLPYSGLGPGQGCYDFQVRYDGRTSATIRQDVSVDPVVVFRTTKVTILNGGPVYWYNGGWKLFSPNPKEVIGGTQNYSPFGSKTADFKLDDVHNPTFTLTITGNAVTNGRLRLIDAAGNGLAGGVATPAVGGSWKPTLPGVTDSNGFLPINVDYVPTKIKMVVNQSSLEQAGNYLWQTSSAVIFCNNAAGQPMAGVVIDQGGGFWDTGIDGAGKAVTDDTGVVEIPIFAGASPKFRATWNHTSQTITQSIVKPFKFQTGAVHSNSGTCTQWANGSWRTFQQDQEMLPGSYKFVFSDGTATATGVAIAAGANFIH